MAYADHSETSSRTVSIIIVALIHAVLGYAFVTGLGMKYVKKAAEQLDVFEVKEEPPPPDEPPPPPPKPAEVPPPPVVAPPKIVETPAPAAPVLPTVPVAPPLPPALPPTPAPPPPPRVAVKAKPRGNPGNWVTSDDYPSRALREERSGSTGFRIVINEKGRVSDCTVTKSSGHADLDSEACRLLTRRARFRAAKGQDGNPITDTYTSRIVWRIPD